MKHDRWEGTSRRCGTAGGHAGPTGIARPLRVLGAAAAAGVVALPLCAPRLASAATATPDPQPQTSAIGEQDVATIAVSPAYEHTGLVVAMAVALSSTGQCGKNCMALWVSHDGGAHWAAAADKGWNQGRPVIAVDAKGQEAIYAVSSSSVQRSTDAGATWQTIGSNGMNVTPSPTYGKDHSVAVTSSSKDVVISDKGIRNVDGSSGAYTDFNFAFSPAYPSGGVHHPALLAAIDPNTHIPFVQQCDVSLHCTGQATLPGATNQFAPATVLTSPHYQMDGAVLVQTSKGIYKSIDGGDTFLPLTIAPADGATATSTPAAAFAPGYDEHGTSRTAYAAVLEVFEDPKSPHTGGGIYRTDDGGSTWRTADGDSLMKGGATTVAVAPDGRLFAGYLRVIGGVSAAGMLCSADGGSTWQAFCSPVGDAAHSGQGGRNISAVPSGPCFGSGCVAPTATAKPNSQSAGGGASGTGPLEGSHAVGVAVPKPPASSPSALLIAAIVLATIVVGLGISALVRRRVMNASADAPL